MNMEQKLDALTQTVELLARMHLDHEKEYHDRCVRTDERLAQLMEAMTRLTNIGEAHEDRLDDLEGKESTPSISPTPNRQNPRGQS
jgi:phage shock protein A